MLEPDLLLLDEPFSALDVTTREDLQKAMIDLQHETHMTVIIVTHEIEVAATMGQKILVLTGQSTAAPQLVENSCAGQINARHRADFADMCEKLRRLLGKKP